MKLSRTPQQTITPQYRIYIDEAGRGPLAGPVTVGLILPLSTNFDLSPFTDSKQLSEKKRKKSYKTIQELDTTGKIIAVSGWASNQEIDQLGIIQAQHLALLRGFFSLFKKLYKTKRRDELIKSPYGENILAVVELDKIMRKRKITGKLLRSIIEIPHTLFTIGGVLIDGNHKFGLDEALGVNIITIIKGDSKNQYISMASIVAKVERDTYIKKISKKFPGYSLEQHKGYGTKTHREAIRKLGVTNFHRSTFCQNIQTKKKTICSFPSYPKAYSFIQPKDSSLTKPKLLLHICCAPDLTRPLHRLKENFHLHLFWYNPNIHPRKEHSKRYEQFLKLVGLEQGDYEILEDRYDPKEFFQAMFEQRATFDPSLEKKPKRDALKKAGEMKERSDRCNPCYQMRLDQAAKAAAKNNIPYFTSTLLISPKKHGGKLFTRGIEGEENNPGTKFLWFDFAKDEGYKKAGELTKKHKLRRQQYCGCGWTIPKDGEKIQGYHGG